MAERLTVIPFQKRIIDRNYITPVGKVSEKFKAGYSIGVDWPVEWVIKDLKDYETVMYVIDETEYFPSYEEFAKSEKIMGDDGIVPAVTPTSPLNSLIHYIMGIKTFSIHFNKYRKEWEELHRLLARKQLEIYKIAADSPAETIFCDENVNSLINSPRLFEKYNVPFYDEAAQILHKKDKILMVHCDGKLKALRDLIQKSEIDVVEAFTPPPIGDLPVDEARAAWKDKVIWTNFPATVWLEGGLDGVERETINILKDAAPGDNFALGITEDIGDIRSLDYVEILRTITRTTMKHGVYPINRS